MKLEAYIVEHTGRKYDRVTLVIDLPKELADYDLVPAWGKEGSLVDKNPTRSAIEVKMRRPKSASVTE